MSLRKYIITESLLDEFIEVLEFKISVIEQMQIESTGLDSPKATIDYLKSIKAGKRPYRLEGVMNLLGFTPTEEEIS